MVLDIQAKKTALKTFLKKGFDPSLINVEITNETATLVDISTHLENLKKHNYLKTHNQLGSYIERSKLHGILNFINNAHNADPNKLTLYFINQKCINTANINADGTFKAIGGVSPTGTGIAYIMLDNGGAIKSENIIHEVMHAIGLTHTFESSHKFKQTKTKNYMDYENKKIHPYKWQ